VKEICSSEGRQQGANKGGSEGMGDNGAGNVAAGKDVVH
jgi:hypothetical protein